MSYGAAVIGTGQPGLHQMQWYAQNPRTVLVAVWGQNEAQLARLQEEYDLALATTELDEILARRDVGCVSLCAPNQLHARWSEHALRAGQHVFCEVPIPLIAWQEYPDPAIQALFDAELNVFLASIDGTAAPPVDVYEGAAIAAVLDAIAESIASGRPWSVGDAGHPRPRKNRQS